LNERRGYDRRRVLLIVGGLLPVALGVALIAVAALAFSARGETEVSERTVRSAMRAAGCTLRTSPAQPSTHLTAIDAKPRYNSFPPTTGPHYHAPVAWARYGAPLLQTQVVHNLEHGGVAIQFGDRIGEQTLEEIGKFYVKERALLLLAPLPELGDEIALTAWTVPDFDFGEKPKRGTGHLATCRRYDEAAFQAFVDAYRGRGPERGATRP
jgi:hypothetical protein